MLSLYGMLCQLRCELLLLLNMAHIVVLYVEGCEVSSAECLDGIAHLTMYHF